MMLRLCVSVALLLSVSVTTQAAGDAAAGKSKAVVCTSCHGVDGKAMIPTYPNLAGQNAQYLELSLKAYRNGERKAGQAAIMAGMSSSLSDEDIADLAAYFSSL
ncbi:c-type cytochrome [Pseudomaricurvus sp.]|uniref:c-type cytochrome n=1 Tax=Pseudomaricurvus sp. TaxID=2004510 RepID=UPI003F6B3C6F